MIPVKDVESAVVAYLRDQLLVNLETVGRDDNLFETGAIDSFGYVELITFLERTFSVKIPDEAVVSGGLSSLSSIASAVAEAGRS